MKILLYDIETMSNLAHTWGKYDQNVIAFEQEWYMLSFAYKWFGQKTTHVKGLPDYKTWKKDKKDDSELVADLWKLFDEADVIIAHNGDRFDNRKTTARFIYHDMKPPQPYLTVDTKKVAKRYFMFNSNSLNDLGKHLGLGEKVEHEGFELWLNCAAGVDSAWKKMKRYNKQDVVLLEKVYEKLRPYMTTHPNVNLVDEDEMCCPTCGKPDLQKRGWGYTRVSKYRRYHCQNCGAWSSGKRISTSVEIR